MPHATMPARRVKTTRRHAKRRFVIGAAFSLFLASAGRPAAGANVEEFPIANTLARPTNIVSDSDGTLWFTETWGDKIGNIDATGAITEFDLPAYCGAYGIVLGSDGNIWFTEGDHGNIGSMTRQGVVTEFVIPGIGSAPGGITAGPDGNLWFTDAGTNRIGKITTAGVITTFALPFAPSRMPQDITVGPDGNLWFTESNANRIGKMTRAGVLTEYVLPTAGSGPWSITRGPDGNLWFTEQEAGKIGRITRFGVITEFSLPRADMRPHAITTGPGGLWFTMEFEGRIGRITTAGVVTEFQSPSGSGDGIVAGPDGHIWFAEGAAAKIARLHTSLAKGDFDGDDQPDLLFRNLLNTARNKLWLMNGVARSDEAEIYPDASSADWIMRGADDFDSSLSPGTGQDFSTDLVFWNQVTGNVEFWLMDGAALVDAPVPLSGGSVLPPNWDLSATADFNHDGKPDIVWRDFLTQQILIWTMNGTAKLGEIVPNPSQAIDSNWIVVAAADYNADGQTDFLWYNFTSGKIVLWYMDADVVRITGQFTSPDAAGDANWKVVASADYSGADGNPGTPPVGSPDIVWRNETSGKQVIWHLDNAGVRVTGGFTSPDSNYPALEWVIAGPR